MNTIQLDKLIEKLKFFQEYIVEETRLGKSIDINLNATIDRVIKSLDKNCEDLIAEKALTEIGEEYG